MTATYKQLYQKLRDSDFSCVPAGFHETEAVYSMVQETYPALCDDSIQCREVCSTKKAQPEWKHRVRTVQQHLHRQGDSRVTKLSKGWYYEPRNLSIEPIPDDLAALSVGQKYNRWELHDVFGGGRYRGIATPGSEPAIFVFTGESGEKHGYNDEFLDNGTFRYSGEGTKGDMTMDGGNEALRDHKSANETVYLFEDADYPWIVTFVGEYEYEDHQWGRGPDKHGNIRDVIRFTLVPAGGTEVSIDSGPPSSLSEDELFATARQSSPTRSGTDPGTSGTGRSYPRSDVVKAFARRIADGVCQGCGEPAPFIDTNGEPFLEVHHIQRLSDGGADDPANVIALCPNCHRRVHYGQDGEAFDRELRRKANARNEQFQPER